MIKKILSIVFSLLLILALFAGCSGGGNSGDSGGEDSSVSDAGDDQELAESALTGKTADILQQVLDGAAASIGSENQLPATVNDPVSAENSAGTLGMTPDDFVSLAEEATVASGALSAFAFQVVIIRGKDANAAETVAEMINNRFDSGKWISVFPEQSLTMISGQYVLLAVGTKVQTEAIAAAFKDAAGGVATDPIIFYTGELGGEGGSEPIPLEDSAGSEG